MNTRQPVADVLREKHPDMRVPPVENPTCASFKEYEEVPETVPLDFLENDVTWVASKLSGAAGALGSEAIELTNFLFRFGCMLEGFVVVFYDLSDWMYNSSPPWASHCDLIEYFFIALNKRPWVSPVVISRGFTEIGYVPKSRVIFKKNR